MLLYKIIETYIHYLFEKAIYIYLIINKNTLLINLVNGYMVIMVTYICFYFEKFLSVYGLD